MKKRTFLKNFAYVTVALILCLTTVTYAASVKLGRMGEINLPINSKDFLTRNESQKPQKFECARTKDCKTGYKCNQTSKKCEDSCLTMTFTAAQTCFEGVISNCSRGSACRCPSPTVADGVGTCFNPCSPNPCNGEHPTCIQNNASYSCACTSSSCSNGQTCNGTNCVSCCTPVANGYCSGCTWACNSGFHLEGGECIPDCVAPVNGYCTASGQTICNSGYTLSGTFCVPIESPSGECFYPYSSGPMGQLCGRDKTGRRCFSGGGDKMCYWGFCARASDENSYRSEDPDTGEYLPPAGLPPDLYCNDEDCCVGG